MSRVGQKAELYLNGKAVGAVTVRGADASWGYGEFVPGEGFADFAALFGQWSLLMHADDTDEKLSKAASDELRQLEQDLSAIRAKLFFHDKKEWVEVMEINIDGPLVEWKKY